MKNELNRTKAASLNAVTMMVTQLISLVLKFGVQTAFIHELSQNYLGLNGLFANIISFLSFADLGIGTAITVALYEPIANKDTQKLRTLISFYKKTYLIIIIIVTTIGLLISPWIFMFIKKPVFSNMQLSLWFLLYLVGTIATYFSAHKRSFLMATQQGYLNSLNDFIFKFLQQVIQILIIVFFHSFTMFLVVQMVMAICSNYQLANMAGKRYPNIFVRDSKISKVSLDKITMKSIKRNVIGAISSKIGSIVVFGTDNLILSTFIGLLAVAKYSNYMLIIQSVNSLFSQVMNSFISSIGNLHVTSSVSKQKNILYRLLYLNAFINLFVSTGLSFAFNRFIAIWAGNNYLLSSTITLGIVLNYSVNQSRYVAQSFISGMGLYWSIRWKSLIEAGINLVVSLIFVIIFKLGILGVVLGTLSSNVLINVFWEPYIVFHDGLNTSLKSYFGKYFFYEVFTTIVVILLVLVSSSLEKMNIMKLVVTTVLVELSVCGLFLLVTCRMDEFRYYKKMFWSLISQVRNRFS